MKKKQAAKLWWFNYTARQRFEREQKQNKYTIKNDPFFIMRLWQMIMLKYKTMKKSLKGK